MKDIDRFVKDWARRLPTPDEKSDARLVADTMRAIKSQPASAQIATIHRHLVQMRLALFAVAALVLLVCGTLLYQTLDEAPALLPVASAYQGLGADDLAEMRQVVAELDILFPEGWRWISKVNGNLSFEPGANRHIAAKGAVDRRLIVSYQILKQDDAGRWSPAGRHDIITSHDEPVDGAEGKTSVWCHLTGDVMVVVRADLSVRSGDAALPVKANLIQRLGETSEVVSRKIGGVSYRVLQSVHQI